MCIHGYWINKVVKMKERPQGRKCIVIWSGGIDSTVEIALLIEKFDYEVFPLFIRRGQKNLKEEEASVNFFSILFKEKYSERFHKTFFLEHEIPPKQLKQLLHNGAHIMRNSDIINDGVRYAAINNIKTVFTGSNTTDTASDSHEKFYLIKTQEVQYALQDKNWVISSKYFQLGWGKKDIIKWGFDNNIPLYRTWSCWESVKKDLEILHCGTCEACKARKNAFLQAGVNDDTKYVN